MTSMHFAVLLLFPLLLEAMQVPDNAGQHHLRLPRGLAPPPLEPPLLQPLCSLNGSGNFGDVPFPPVTVLPTLQRLLEEFPLASMTCSVAWKSTWCLLQFADPEVLFEVHGRAQEWRCWVKNGGPRPGTDGADKDARVPLKRGKAPSRRRPGKLVLSTSTDNEKSAPCARFDALNQLMTQRQRKRRAWLDFSDKGLFERGVCVHCVRGLGDL